MQTPTAVIIGAGIGGLATALRLAHVGVAVTVLEARDGPGGKMRTVPSQSGPIDAGPTVLTMKHVFEDLFMSVGEKLAEHLVLEPLSTLARHYWSDGTMLDLHADRAESTRAIADVFGKAEAQNFARFCARTARLFDAFEQPMMQSPEPSVSSLGAVVARRPSLLRDMAPHQKMDQLLRSSFRDPKLRQLFGRYATYVGGSPYASPGLLSLIWHAEQTGVYAVQGGMHKLAQAIMQLAQARGVIFHFNTPATRLVRQNGRITSVETANDRFAADITVFNGDPRALETGLLGPGAQGAVQMDQVAPRSLSAHVMAFDAGYQGPDLSHHTVFFADDPKDEFGPLAEGRIPQDATLYVCAQDWPAPSTTRQRFEIIRNAPPGLKPSTEENTQCQTRILNRLASFGLSFGPAPGPDAMTAPADFDQMFPASQGSLYGRSPHGMMAAFKRPTARTPVPGLYLCGGGAHPGAGVPMATLSGQHAAATIMHDLALTSPSRPTAMRGGMSTA